MVTMAQRIEELREEKGLSRPAFAAALGFPKTAPEKFETGRQTPTRDQQQKMADFFGVSLFYLRGESADRTRQDSWMDDAYADSDPGHAPMAAAKKAVKAAMTGSAPSQGDGSMFGAFKNSKGFQEMVRSTVLEVLRSPEGEEILAQVIRKELTRHR